MELFILCRFWRSLWTKVEVFHVTLGYMFPSFHSLLQGHYFPGRRAGSSSGDRPSIEATGIQPEQTPALFHLTSWKNLTRLQALRITIRN